MTALCLILAMALAAAPAPAPTPTENLIARLILTEAAQDGERLPSGNTDAPGQCMRYQINAFASASASFRLPECPEVPLAMPDTYAQDEQRVYGSAWEMPPASDGNPFVEAARFQYDRDLTAKQNRDAAKAFLSQARAGDMLQMMAVFDNGNRGTHTLLFTQPYDARDGMLHWSDSNFHNVVVSGVKYGYAHSDQSARLDDVAAWLAADIGCAATLYRLREDLIALP